MALHEIPSKYADRITLTDNGCWLWTGAKTNTGYGYLKLRNQNQLAHRAFYEELVGPISSGLQLDHLCRSKLCVNPAHLEPVTAKENHQRAAALITRCINGHEYTPENTGFQGAGYRYCKKCNRIRQRRHQLRSN